MPFGSRSRRAVLVGLVGFALSGHRAAAHAILEDSDPASGATVPPGLVHLKLRYNSRIDRTRSGLTLTGPGQAKTSLKIDPDGPPDILTAEASLAPGAYVVRWQVLAVDGHITRGDIPFTVGGH